MSEFITGRDRVRRFLLYVRQFQMAVLREINVAPAQLHPNSWAAVQAFLAVCLAIGIAPSSGPFSDLYKNFKNQFFKVIIDEVGLHEFHDAEGNPLFPFYWTRNPRKIKAYSVGTMNPVDLEAVRTINALPRRLSACILVECLRHEDCEGKAFGMGAGGSSSNAPRPPIIKRASSTSRMLSIPLAGFRATPTVDVVVSPGVAVATGSEPPHNLSHVFLDPSSKAATTSAQPLVRKRKDHKEGERSASKKGRKEKEGSSSRFASKKGRKGKEGSSSWPLPNDIFSPEFNISDRTNFHMSSTHRSLIEGLSEPVLTNAMLEMSTRATSLAWYLREFADRRGAENIRAELLAEKKVSEDLRAAME
ncbi:uncharacterized protein HKW66_Vig0082010 [Vigna angularis]|uniref:Uncharacterized protein n=1 Tax=Phaseolus angularis TaxID=3914 RepID=A0A8T0KHD8_PHAAN|nr:uncharacterized protein HKW66_Vig0082010 [Vigna angularis]